MNEYSYRFLHGFVHIYWLFLLILHNLESTYSIFTISRISWLLIPSHLVYIYEKWSYFFFYKHKFFFLVVFLKPIRHYQSYSLWVGLNLCAYSWWHHVYVRRKRYTNQVRNAFQEEVVIKHQADWFNLANFFFFFFFLICTVCIVWRLK
jgi:hypothetical protein